METFSSSYFHKRFYATLVLPVILALFSVTATAATLGFGVEKGKVGDGLLVTVLDEVTFKPVPGAAVAISRLGPAANSEPAFAGGHTSSLGQVHFHHFASALNSVKASKVGFATTLLVGVTGDGKITLLLKRSEDPPTVVLNGSFRQWIKRTGVGYVLGGVALRPLSVADLASVDSRIAVSPLRDVIKVFGDRNIPSNVMLPDQDLFLPVGGVSLNKPDYRFPVLQDQELYMMAFQAEIRALDILPAYQPGGSLSISLLNKLKIQRVSITSAFTPNSDQKVDFDIGSALTPRHDVTVVRPPFESDVVVADLIDLRGDRLALAPTDLKVVLSASKFNEPIRPVRLSSSTSELGVSRSLVAVALANSGQRFSVVLAHGDSGRAVQMVSFFDAPLLAPFATLPSSIHLEPTAKGVTTLVLGARNTVGDGKTTQPQWIVHLLPSAGAVDIPAATLTYAAPIDRYSITRFEFGEGFQEDQVDARGQFASLTRVSRTEAKSSQPTE